jgi:hypothetical protein
MMRVLYCIVVVIVFLIHTTLAASTVVTNIDRDTTLYASGTPHKIPNTIVVNATLTIEPGVTIELSADACKYCCCLIPLY